MTIRWKVVEQYFTVVLFVFQFYPVSVVTGSMELLNEACSLRSIERRLRKVFKSVFFPLH